MSLGCVLTRNTDWSFTSAGAITQFSQAAFDDGRTWFEIGNPTRLLIPTGVTEVEIFMAMYDSAGIPGTSDVLMYLRKNGVDFMKGIKDNPTFTSFNKSTGVIDVAPGDYFELANDVFTSGTVNLDFEFLAFSALTPSASDLGFVVANLLVDQSVNVGADCVWGTPSVDTTSAFNGTTGFVVPAGCTIAVVSFDSRTTGAFTATGFSGITLNGTYVRRSASTEENWHPGQNYGPIPVTPGDVIRFRAQHGSATLDATYTRANIQWVA